MAQTLVAAQALSGQSLGRSGSNGMKQQGNRLLTFLVVKKSRSASPSQQTMVDKLG